METLIPINVVVGDRSYRIKIEQKNEEIVRKTVKVISDKLIEFKINFSGKDMQDYIAMVILWYATNAMEEAPLSPEITQKMDVLESMLDRALLK
jgi:hypothetical protein